MTLRLALKGCGKEAETEGEEEQSSDMLSWQEGRDKGQCILQAGPEEGLRRYKGWGGSGQPP